MAQAFDAYGNALPPTPPVIPVGIGGVLGGLAAHLFPNARAEELRELAEKIPDSADTITADLREGASNTLFKGSPEMARKFYRNKALRANSLRMLGGIGVGALTGYGLSRIFGED
jgi:hypothetical protein